MRRLWPLLVLVSLLLGCKGEDATADAAPAPGPKTEAQQKAEARFKAMPPPGGQPAPRTP